MKNLFSKSLMAAAAVMMFASCSNEEPTFGGANGDETNVTLGLSVAGAGTKAAADMNFDNLTTISNVAVVPFIGENTPQKPVRWESVTSTTEPATVQLVNTVDRFKVYGNLTTNQYANTLDVYKLTNADFALKAIEGKLINGTQCYNPHEALYYFANATSFYRVETATDWKTISEDDWGTARTGAIGTDKFIKISDVNYAVGTLVAAIMDGDDTACFYSSVSEVEGETVVTGEGATAQAADVSVSAILIEGQKDFDVNFNTLSTSKTVYEEAEQNAEGAAYNFSTVKVSTTTGGEYNYTNGNVFTIVSPTANGEEVNVNIEFNLPAGKFLKTTSGKVIGDTESATKFYLGLKLTKDADHTNEVFAADFVTFLNATVKNWGIASENPVTVTNAEIGVEFDTTWQEGNVYEIEI